MVRKEAGVKRAGHAGTLDPAASGVLLVLLGQAVRVSEYAMALPKTYRARVHFGVETTTYDSEGEVTARTEADFDEARLRETMGSFTGEIMQAPPPFSAVKVGGKRAYALARAGKPPELSPRPVTVYRAEMLEFDPPIAEVEIVCGRGTYIRSIAHDLGQMLGCGAHLAGLERTAIGPFRIGEAATMEQVESALAGGTWPAMLRPAGDALITLPQLTFSAGEERRLRHGLPGMPSGAEKSVGGEARAYAESGEFIGIVKSDDGEGGWRPHKIFAPSGSVEL
jgi:tRNA pseudouridine55 synthase